MHTHTHKYMHDIILHMFEYTYDLICVHVYSCTYAVSTGIDTHPNASVDI